MSTLIGKNVNNKIKNLRNIYAGIFSMLQSLTPIQTWDFQPISAEKPHGATIIVYRRAPQGIEYLILHRAFYGADYEGEWAWSPPSGARLPGESLAGCASRELHEESGFRLVLQVTAFDSPDWAVFMAEASPQDSQVVDLTGGQGEHDRFAWVTLEEAVKRCQPAVVHQPILQVDQALKTKNRSHRQEKISILVRWKQAAQALKRQVYTLYLVYRDPRTPWCARLFAALVVAYAFSPIDLIPDPIPLLGYLDDLLLVPLEVFLALRMIPREVLADCRQRAASEAQSTRPRSFLGAVLVILLWLLAAGLVIYWLIGWFRKERISDQ